MNLLLKELRDHWLIGGSRLEIKIFLWMTVISDKRQEEDCWPCLLALGYCDD